MTVQEEIPAEGGEADDEHQISMLAMLYQNKLKEGNKKERRRFKMTLEKFTKPQVADYPAITIRRNGSICINSYAIKEFNLEKVRRVVLYYDSKEHIMGIRPTEDAKEPSAFRISVERGRTHTISCQGFLRHCKIPFKEGSRILRVGWDEKGKMMLVKIS